MGTIAGFDYSRWRTNEDDEREYLLDGYDEWHTIEEIKEMAAEMNGWERDADRWNIEDNGDGLDWSGD